MRLLYLLLLTVLLSGEATAQLAYTQRLGHPRAFNDAAGENIKRWRSACGIANQAEYPAHWETQKTRVWDPLVAYVAGLSSSIIGDVSSPPTKSQWNNVISPRVEAAAATYWLGLDQGGAAEAASDAARDKLYAWFDEMETAVTAYGSWEWAQDDGEHTEGASIFALAFAYDVLYNEATAGTVAEQDRIEWLCHFLWGNMQWVAEYKTLLSYVADYRHLMKFAVFSILYGDPELDTFDLLGGEDGPAQLIPPGAAGVPKDYSLGEIQRVLNTLKGVDEELWLARSINTLGARMAYPEDGQSHPFEDIWAAWVYRNGVVGGADPFVAYAGHFANLDKWTIFRVTSTGQNVGHRTDGYGADQKLSGASNYVCGYLGATLDQDEYAAGIMDAIMDEYFTVGGRDLWRMLVCDDRSFPHTFPSGPEDYPTCATLTDLSGPFEDGGRGPYTFFRSDWDYVSGSEVHEQDVITAVLHAGPNSGMGHDPGFAGGNLNVQLGPTRGWNRAGIYSSTIDGPYAATGNGNAGGNSLRIIDPNHPLYTTEVPFDATNNEDWQRKWEVRVGAQVRTDLRSGGSYTPYSDNFGAVPRSYSPFRVPRFFREHVDRWGLRFPGTPNAAAYTRVNADALWPNNVVPDDPYGAGGDVHEYEFISNAELAVDFIPDPDDRGHGFFVVMWRVTTLSDGCHFILPQWGGEKDPGEYFLNDGASWDGGTAPHPTHGGTPLQTSSDGLSWGYVFRPEGSSDATASTWSTTLAHCSLPDAAIELRRVGGLANDGDAMHGWSFWSDGDGPGDCDTEGACAGSYECTDPVPGTWRGNVAGSNPPPSNPTYRWSFPETGVSFAFCWDNIGNGSGEEWENATLDSVYSSPRFYRYEFRMTQPTAGDWVGVQVWEVEHGVATTTPVTNNTTGAERISLEIGTGITWNGSADRTDDTGTSYQTNVLDHPYRHHLEGMAPGLYAIRHEHPDFIGEESDLGPGRLFYATSRPTEGTLSYETELGGRFTVARIEDHASHVPAGE